MDTSSVIAFGIPAIMIVAGLVAFIIPILLSSYESKVLSCFCHVGHCMMPYVPNLWFLK
jgi:hypothetical protein